MSGITFSTRTSTSAGQVRASEAHMPGGDFLTITASQRLDRVDLGLLGNMGHCYMMFTAAQARSIAAELLACADAREAAQGRG